MNAAAPLVQRSAGCHDLLHCSESGSAQYLAHRLLHVCWHGAHLADRVFSMLAATNIRMRIMYDGWAS